MQYIIPGKDKSLPKCQIDLVSQDTKKVVASTTLPADVLYSAFRVSKECGNKIVKKWVPHTYSAFKEFQLESYNLSKTAIEIIKKKLKGQKITFEKSGLSKREWDELSSKFKFK